MKFICKLMNKKIKLYTVDLCKHENLLAFVFFQIDFLGIDVDFFELYLLLSSLNKINSLTAPTSTWMKNRKMNNLIR